MSTPPFTVKAIMLGDARVGKTTLAAAMRQAGAARDWRRAYRPTIGLDHATRSVVMTNAAARRAMVAVHLWDSASSPGVETLVRTFAAQCSVFFVVFDVSRRDTFTRALDHWMRFTRRPVAEGPHLVNGGRSAWLVATHVSERSPRQVTHEEGVAAAASHGCQYVEALDPSTLLPGLVLDVLVGHTNEAMLFLTTTPADEPPGAAPTATLLAPPPEEPTARHIKDDDDFSEELLVFSGRRFVSRRFRVLCNGFRALVTGAIWSVQRRLCFCVRRP